MTVMVLLAVPLVLLVAKVAFDTWRYEKEMRERRRGYESFEAEVQRRAAVKGEGL